MPRNLSLICRFIFTSVLLGAIFSSAASAAPTFSLQGRILKPSGGVLEVAGVQFDIRVLSPDANSCILYEETQTKDLTGSGGLFNISLNDGSGTRSDGLPHPFEKTFSNQASFNVPSTKCGSGAGTVTYTPGANDERTVLIYFKEPGATAWEQMPPMTLSHSSFAYEAGDSLKLGGFGAASMCRVVDGSGNPAAAAPFTSAQFAELVSVASGNYAKTSTNGATVVSSVAGTPATGLTAGQMWYDSTAGQMKYYDGTVKTVGTSGGSVTSVAAGTGLTGGPITTTGTLAVDVGTAAGKIVQVQTGGKLPALDGSNLTNVTATSITGMTLNDGNIWVGNGSNVVSAVVPSGDATMTNLGAITVNKIKGTAVSASPTALGQVLKYNGTTAYAPGFIGIADIRSTVAGNAQFIPTNCTASQTLVWQSPTDVMACTAISVTASNFASQSQNTVLAGPSSGGAGAPSFRTIASADLPLTGATGIYANGGNSFGGAAAIGTNDNNSLAIKTNNTTRVTIDSAGNVGVGTASPQSVFHVNAGGQRALIESNAVNAVISPLNLLNNDTGTSGSGMVFSAGSATGYIGGLASQRIDASSNSRTSLRVLSNGGLTAGDTTAAAYLEGTAAGPKFVVNGKVGVGTNTPAGALDVQGGTASAGNGTDINLVAQSGLASGNTNGGNINLTAGAANGTGTPGQINIASSGINVAGGSAPGANPPAGFTGMYSSSPNRLDFATNGVLRYSILSYGYVVMGTASSAVVGNHFVDFGSNQNGFSMDNNGAYLNTQSTKRLTVDNTGNVAINTAPATSPNYGLLSLGSGAFDGTTAGFFTGNANGTVIAANAVSAYTGDLANFQIGGVSKFKVDSSGNITSAGTTSSSGNYSTAGNISTTGAGTITSAGGLTVSSGGATLTGGITNNSGGIVGAGNITGVGANLTGAGAMTVAAGGSAQNLTLNSSTSGSVNLGSGNGTSLSVLDGGASTVNYLTMKGSATGLAPTLGTAGSDANINLVLAPKGAGNVGIGTTTPALPLDVNGTVRGTGLSAQQANSNVGLNVTNTSSTAARYPSANIINYSGGFGGSSSINLKQANGSSASAAATTSSDRLGVISGFGHTGTAFASSGPSVVFDPTENYSTTATGGRISFLTVPNGTTTSLERMRIDQNGNVGIGTTTPQNLLEVAGTLSLYNVGDNNRVTLINGYYGLNVLPQSGTGGGFTVARDAGTGRSYVGTGTNNGFATNMRNLLDDGAGKAWFTGNVGIGTTSPQEKLTVGGSSAIAIIHTAPWDHMRLWHDGSVSYIDSGGADNGLALRVDATAVGYPAASYPEIMRLLPNGNVGIGTTTPTALLNLKAGTTTANTSPLKFTTGVNLTTPEPGAVEYDGTNLYFTDSTPTRRTIATTSSGSFTNVSSIANASGNITLAPTSSTGAVLINSGTASLGTNSGALVVTGGVGISGDANVGGSFSMNGNGTHSESYTGTSTASSITANLLTGGNILNLTSNSTAAAAGNTGLNIAISGANATAGITRYGLQSAVTATGSTSTNVGASFSASGGTNNYGLLVPSGNVGIGTTAPSSKLYVAGGTYGAASGAGSGANQSAYAIGAQSLGVDASIYSYGPICSGNSSGSCGGSSGVVIGSNNTAAAVNIANSGASFFNAGNVGIGTTTPTAKLSVSGVLAGRGIDANPNDSGYILTSYNASASNAEQFNIKHNLGNVEIRNERGNIGFTAGNVGIGTTAPGAIVDISTSGGSEDINMRFYDTTASATATRSLAWHTNNGGSPNFDYAKIKAGYGASFNNSSMTFSLADASRTLQDRMTINVSGNVGIGTTTPGKTLDVNGDIQIPNGKAIYTKTSGGTVSNLINMATYDEIGIGGNSINKVDIVSSGNQMVTVASSGVGIGTGATAPKSKLDVAGAVAVGTYANVTAAPANSLIVSGSVGVGTSSPQTTLQVAGVISPATNNTYTLGNATYRFTEVYATNGVINTSDRREKKDIHGTDLGLDFINKLRPVSYRWNTGVDSEVHYGLIAQEAETAIASVGKGEKTSIVTHDAATDRYGVRYSELISPLIKAVQEVYLRLTRVEAEQASQAQALALKASQVEVNQVKLENEKLKQENAAMKLRLDKIERMLNSK